MFYFIICIIFFIIFFTKNKISLNKILYFCLSINGSIFISLI